LNQGCPLSSYTFAASFDPAIRELEEHFNLVAYADDVLLQMGDKSKEETL